MGSPTNGVETALNRINAVATQTENQPEQAPTPPEPAPEEPSPENARAPEEAAQPAASETETAPVEDQANLVPVPDVTTYYDYYAADTLAASGFEVVYVRDYQQGFAPRGVTWATEPAPGELAPVGSTVTVYATPQDRPPQPVF